MLTSLRLENWKSFGAGEGARNSFELGPLTLLVGPNASGKSNVLDALRFLQGAALDFPLVDVLQGRWEGEREIWPPIRGGAVEAARKGETTFGLTSGWEISGRHLSYLLEVSCDTTTSVRREALFEAGQHLIDTHAASLGKQAGRDAAGAISVALKSVGGGADTMQRHRAERSLLGQVDASSPVPLSAVGAAHALRDALRRTVFLDIRPALMRDYRPANGGHLGSSGENISPFLGALAPDRLADVVGWLSELCGPEVSGIEFDRTQLREVMMMLVETDGRRISARSMSDGTLRFLGELVALTTAPPGTLVVLEEPDAGLHPARIRLLAELLETVTSPDGGGIQVLATTHSPTLLAHLSREALGNVVALGRDPTSGTSVCSRLRDLEYFDTLAGARDVEHLVSTGWIERAL